MKLLRKSIGKSLTWKNLVTQHVENAKTILRRIKELENVLKINQLCNISKIKLSKMRILVQWF